ncbi:MAG: Purine nucleoside phosphoramidase [Chlamydiia bacterium]|nr:Purine nucleoside phosphoramidase [Chlamydiia bacterium]
MTTIFKKIIERDISAEILYEDDDIICIHDKFPQAPIHILIITKKIIPNIQELKVEDMHLLPKIFAKAQELASQFGVQDGYRILTNNGPSAGQTVLHLHFHLLGGKVLGGKGG